MTDYRACGTCSTRIRVVSGIPALNWGQDPAGRVAVTFTHPIKGRFLARDEQPTAFEHTYSVHTCNQSQRLL